MPEIPNVVSGEPVESVWGNDIRDRTIMKYADLTALLNSVPFPELGETAWLNDPGYLVVCVDVAAPGTWNPIYDAVESNGRFVNTSGDTMTGTLFGPRLEATTTLDGPLLSYYSHQSGNVPLSATETLIGSFTSPSSGRWLLMPILQGSYSGMENVNLMQLLIKIDGLQFEIAGQNLFRQWAGPGISTGQVNIAMQFVTAFYSAGKTFEMYARTSLNDATGSAFATHLDWYAQRLNAVNQTTAALDALWTP